MSSMREKKNRKWQNLIYKQCPNCDADMDVDGKYLRCPNPSPYELGKDCFFISKENAVEILSNPGHVAYQHMTEEEKEMIDNIVEF